MLLHTNKILYIEFADFLAAGWKEDSIKKANLRNGGNWQMIDHPTDKRKVLVQYDTLTDAHKEKLQIWLRKKHGCNHTMQCNCGNPYEYVAKEPIRKLIQKDFKAEGYYTAYKLSDGRNLPLQYINQYTVAASFINMLLQVNSNKKLLKTTLNLSLDSFWKHVEEIIKSDNIDLPASYKRLRQKMLDYEKNGYEVLISSKFGNKQALKIADEVSESLLIELLSDYRQFDDVIVSVQYNKWASLNGYKTITAQTVGNWRRDNSMLLISDREGRDVFNQLARRKVVRMRPSYPTALWESDDNHLDWWFAGDSANEYRKLKGIIVTDSFNDYILGYAVTDKDLKGDEIVRLAYLNAMYHVKELTGGWYLPFEVKTDQWNIEKLRPFYKSITNDHYYDTPVGSKNRGWLENFFGHIDWERCMKIGFNNYTGHNISAKTRGVNLEAVRANKKEWVHIKDAETQLAEFVNRLRTVPKNFDEKNQSRQQEWLQAFALTPDTKKIQITDEQMLLKFGFRHSHSTRIQENIVKPTILGVEYRYSIPPAFYSTNRGKKVDFIYDPYNMNRILVTDNEGLRFIAHSVTPVAGCMADMEEFGGRELLNKILGEAKQENTAIGEAKEKRKQVLLANNIDTEDILKLGVSVPKALKQQAEGNYYLPTPNLNATQENETDFDLYSTILNR